MSMLWNWIFERPVIEHGSGVISIAMMSVVDAREA